MWMFEPDGQYVVKSGYRALQFWKNIDQLQPSTSSTSTKVWDKIWKIHSIPRHKIILWRVLNNALPVRYELIKRRIRASLLCPRCNSKIETLTHTFMTCHMVSRT